MKRSYQICKQCIMDTSDSMITFNKDGICNHCNQYKEQVQYLYSREELKRVAEIIKKEGKDKKYDCVLAVSGGVDSCMAAYTAKKYGLRPLAIHVDNGWNSEISQSNIERVLKQLNINLYTHVIDWEEFKDLQVSFLKSSVSNIDYPYDHAILSLFFEMAKKMGVRYIVHGGNDRTEFIMPRGWGYNSWDQKHLRAIHKKFGKIKNLKTYPSVSMWQLFYYSFIKKIRNFRILDYIDYNKKEAKEFLIKEFGWKDYGGKHCESIYTRFFLGYVLPKKFGFDRNRAWLSNLIISGQMARREALKELETGFYSSEKEMEENKGYIIKKLGFTTEEFEKIMALPIKNYSDYPNNSFFLNRSGFIVKLARKVLRKI
ncbi:N-acetyl sugar amidotransferase [Patescibacteria group bacterium]|nr:N-acetyl sugar amidotransferase [Patescibacteria group bacterium]